MPPKTDANVTAAILAAIPEPFFIFDENGRYVQVLGGIDRDRYHDGRHLVGQRIHDVMAAPLADRFVDQIRRAIARDRVTTFVYPLSARDIQGSEALPGPEGRQWFEAHISPIRNVADMPRMVVWMAFSITKLHDTIAEKDALIRELQKAIGEIKTLRGILPICAHCKKIRDDQGYWNQLENYIQSHSEADFSHGICEECLRRYYPEFAPDIGPPLD
jgi:PAS domain-containing protein